jgi:hypothetical protein
MVWLLNWQKSGGPEAPAKKDFFFAPAFLICLCKILKLFRFAMMNQSLTKQNTIIAQISLDYLIEQSASDCTACNGCEPKQMEITMLVAVGKGIELEVDVTRLNNEVRDHVMRTGLRSLLVDAHASATVKADPENYIKRSRELVEKKLASLYAGVVRAQSLGGLKAPTDPVGMVILRLARKAVQRDRAKEIASAPKAEKLALLNKLAAAYAAEHDETLRARAVKIAALEEGDPVPPAILTKPAKKKAA